MKENSRWAYFLLWTVVGCAIYITHQAINSSTTNLEQAASNALRLMADRHWEEALPALDQAVRYQPDRGYYYLYRADANLRLRNFELAVSNSDQAIARHLPPSWKALALTTKGAALAALGKPREALEILNHAITQEPALAEAHFYRSMVYSALDKPDEAMQDRKKCPANFSPEFISYLTGAEELEAALRKNLIVEPDSVKTFSLGFDRLIADLYWLSFVQYYGDRKACFQDKYRQAPAYLNLICKIDPHFIQAYWFASFVLAADLNMKKEADDLLKYGIEQNPDNWTLPYIAGFNQYLYMRNAAAAAKYYRLGASRPGAPEWLATQAQILEENIPARTKRSKTWQNMYEKATDVLVRQKAREMLTLIWSRIYYDAPPQSQGMRDNALAHLAKVGAELLPAEQIPPLEPEENEPAKEISPQNSAQKRDHGS